MLLLTTLTAAKYIDAKMRQGNKALTDAEQEQVFDQVLYLFRFTQGPFRSYGRSLLILQNSKGSLRSLLHSVVCEAFAAQQKRFFGEGEDYAIETSKRQVWVHRDAK
jgi:hypothetical protein